MERYKNIIDNINKSKDVFKVVQDLSIDELEKILIYASDKYYNDEDLSNIRLEGKIKALDFAGIKI